MMPGLIFEYFQSDEKEQRTFMPVRMHSSQLRVGVYALWLRALTCRGVLQFYRFFKSAVKIPPHKISGDAS